MKKIIHHIRRQPEKVRRHILHLSTLVIAVVLLLVWVYSLGASFSNPETQAKVSNDLKPFSVLKDNLVDGYKSISDSQ